MTGQLVGHYRIIEKIGSGGMGEVFRARDERLERDVALKLVRPSSSGNQDLLRRFDQEARAAAALNHPNIVAIYDVGIDNGFPFIVCELLQGETLRARLQQGPFTLREATDYALQMVQGLIAAHEGRIIHRDLKPENLFLTRDGRLKILDFGVAKLQPSVEGGRSVEAMTTVTKSGAVVGTVAYMSPEQLRGKSVDHRSDIFSAGAILYEMFSGTRAFSGETDVDTMTAVLREEPPEIDPKQADVPPAFQEIVRHCLEKDPGKRFQSARDLAFALETLSGSPGKGTGFFRSKSWTVRVLPLAVAGLCLAAAMLYAGMRIRPVPAQLSYTRLTFEAGTIYSARFAHDGESIIYGAAWNNKALQLFSTVGNSLLAQPLNLTGANLLAVSSSDELAVLLRGTHLSHLETENGTLARAPLAGGAPREMLTDVRWADWGKDGELAVIHHTGGHSRLEYPIGHVLYQNDGWISYLRFSPKGDKLAFLDHPGLWDDGGSVHVIDLAGHDQMLSNGWSSEDGLAWNPDGKEIWFAAAPTGTTRSLRAIDLSGRLRTILELPASLSLLDVAPDGRALVSLSSDRLSMASAALDTRNEVDLSWHDWNIPKEISRDGRSVLFEDASEAAGLNYAVAIRGLDGSLPIRLGAGSSGGLSPDGEWAISITPHSPQRLTLLPLGAGQPRSIEVSSLEHMQVGIGRFLPDGKRLVIDGNEPGRPARCFVIDVTGGIPRPVTPEGTGSGVVSPDGRYVVGYGPNSEIALYPLEESAARFIPGLKKGFTPVQWSEDSASLYGYIFGEEPSNVYRVDIATGKETFVKELRPGVPAGVIYIGPVVVSRDGTRFAYAYAQTLSTLYLISGLR